MGHPRVMFPEVERRERTGLGQVVSDEPSDEPAVRRGMQGIEQRQRRPYIVQGDEIAERLRRQAARSLGRRAARAEGTSIRHAEGDRGVALRRDRGPVPGAARERRREAQHRHEVPQRPYGRGVHALRRRGRHGLEHVQAGDEGIVRGRERRRRRHPEHDLRQRRRAREPADVGRQLATQVGQVEGAERMELARFAEVQLGHAFAQQLEPRPEPALGTQRALGDGALDPQVPRREAHDLGRLAVTVGLEHDGRGGDEGHATASPPPRPSSDTRPR